MIKQYKILNNLYILMPNIVKKEDCITRNLFNTIYFKFSDTLRTSYLFEGFSDLYDLKHSIKIKITK